MENNTVAVVDTVYNYKCDSIYDELKQIDWTFTDAKTRGETHGVHPYPAKFIPQIPRKLISVLYPKDGSLILDPFCGSGTTLVEAAIAGAPAVGIDLSPLACLISKVKVTPLKKSLIDSADNVLNRITKKNIATPFIPALDHWFKPEIQKILSLMMNSIEMEEDIDVKDALKVALSSIIVRVSNQESDTRYAAIEKNIGINDVRELFYRSVQTLNNALQNTWPVLFTKNQIKIINKDILLVKRKEISKPVSLVITSPPYPNAYEYWLYHKYRMYWLGMDPIAVRNNEIGARPHYFKKNPQTANDFENQMDKVFKLLSQILVMGGHVCFQIGNSIIRGEKIDNSKLLVRAAEKNGFENAAIFERGIPNQKKSFNPSHGSIKKEKILIFKLSKR